MKKRIIAVLLSAVMAFGLMPGLDSRADAMNVNVTIDTTFVKNVFANNTNSYYDVGGDGSAIGLYGPDDIENAITISPRDGIFDCTYVRYSDGTDLGYINRTKMFTVLYDTDTDLELYNAGRSLNITVNGMPLYMQRAGDESTHIYSNDLFQGYIQITNEPHGYYGFKIYLFEGFVLNDVMYRLYNPNSGEHFYTSNIYERNNLISLGWNDEGIGWVAPASSNTPVYRLYNSIGGEHHYTTSVAERDSLIAAGWTYESIGWYSDDNQTVPLYRQYNPNEFANNHNYTTSLDENNWLVSLGWQAEGIGWYGVG